MFEIVLAMVGGITVGGCLAWLTGTGQRARLGEEVGRRCAAEAAASRIPGLEEELRAVRTESELRLALLREQEGQGREKQKAADEKLALLEDAKRTLTDAFSALSANALKANNDSFLQLANESMQKFQEHAKGDLEARGKAVESLVEPIRESLTRVDGKLGEIERERQTSYAALNEQLRGLVQEHLPLLRQETTSLVKALRQPAARGRWGEMQLKRVVEMAGMLSHCDFIEQQSGDTDDGKLRPDLIVRLPGGKQIVVDAKAPLIAYLDAAETNDDAVREAQLARHAQQVRTHMSALGRKAYWEAFEPTPEFVVMFLPGESFFSAALQQDPGLIEYGVNEKVIPATPTTLIALLRGVAYGWRQEALALNAAQIASLGKELFDRVGTLAEHWQAVGGKLGGAVEAYNKSVATLESRVLPSVRKFRDLKAVAAESEIEELIALDQSPRTLTAPELTVNQIGSAALLEA